MTAEKLHILSNVIYISTWIGICATLCGGTLILLILHINTTREGSKLIRILSITSISCFTMALVFCLIAFAVPINGEVMQIISLSLTDIFWSSGMCKLIEFV